LRFGGQHIATTPHRQHRKDDSLAKFHFDLKVVSSEYATFIADDH
jgi:hypothetical protein